MPHHTTDTRNAPATSDLIRVEPGAQHEDEQPHASEDQGFLTAMMTELPAGCCFFPDTNLMSTAEQK
ncbi:hypothetical protein EEB11_01995 [Pseudotabrizicola sediminis]|uniref:Uncharacterized protein n=1 Tax=Pseudotabrizicola sediminis TaxID=2486418 RepID=A0ABY2KV57_9RHOB|nr:hypothetical protein [Pseudotabrizicola sediminis]TGD45346.1 hypothetical protein EEB11_01995 [Pseudotabrizicola sediminis]